MHRNLAIILLGFAAAAVSPSFALASEAWRSGFDAPQPALNLTQPDRVFVAGLAPGENLSGPAKSAATAEPHCSPEALRYGTCTDVSNAATTGFLSGHAHAMNPAVAGGAAGGVMVLEGLAAALKDD
jgi:hypothetical protein